MECLHPCTVCLFGICWQWSRRVSKMWWTNGWSQDFCRFVTEGMGMSSGKKLFQIDKACSLSGYGSDGRWLGRGCCIRSEATSADAKKADGARMEALYNPRLPELTGRVACGHESPCSKSMLVILEMMDLKEVPELQRGVKQRQARCVGCAGVLGSKVSDAGWW